MRPLFNITTIAAVFFLGCASTTKLYHPPEPIPDDRLHVPKPENRSIHTYAEYFEKQVPVQLKETLDIPRQWRHLTADPYESLNIDGWGNVPNSSWFTNRKGSHTIPLEKLIKGPNTGNGPDTSDVWIITRAKTQGVTPGFTIKDGKDDFYVIKFDPPHYQELASGAEVISTKLFYAAGYNTPENYITVFDPGILRMGKEVNFTDEKGHKRQMTLNDLQDILNRVPKRSDGKIRALASKYVPGVPIGPFTYAGLRQDDYNDFIPHEHRRELRGLRLICAWLNHFDTKDGNTFDSYVTVNGKSYVRHYLIDFGATLGSASHSPNDLWRGFRYDIDPAVIIQNSLLLGIHVHDWEKLPGAIYPSIGVFEADLFSPLEYKPQIPNPAFQNMTDNDGYWAAKIITSFSDNELWAVIQQARYSNPDAAEYLHDVLCKRRDKIGRLLFQQVAPLDDFSLKSETLFFKDLAVQRNYALKQERIYNCAIACSGVEKALDLGTVDIEKGIPLPDQNCNQIKITITVSLHKNPEWKRSLEIYAAPTDQGAWELLGCKRN
jgi:hypothetical protein